MIPTRETYATVTGGIPGESITMAVDVNAMAHIMNVLTKLYSDPLGTIIREYSTNAWDSHIMAGCDDTPITVTTPSTFDDFLRIKDTGLGLSADDIRDVYANYGASTKRDTNAVAGMLGLGSKSALAYTEMFVVTAIKDGVKTVVHVSRDDQGVGHMNIVSTKDTTDGNGVEIAIPIRPADRMEVKRRAQRFFRFWGKGQVMLNGEDPSLRDTMTKVTDNLFLLEDPAYDFYKDTRSYVVMGNVAYPIDNDRAIGNDVRHAHTRQQVVAFIDMGSVDFTPSREALNYTSKTMAHLESIDATYADYIRKGIQETIDKQPDILHGLAEAMNATDSYVFSYDGFTYKGKEFKVNTDGTHTVYSGHLRMYHPHNTGRYKSSDYGGGGFVQHQLFNTIRVYRSAIGEGKTFVVLNNFDGHTNKNTNVTNMNITAADWRKIAYALEQAHIEPVLPIFYTSGNWDTSKNDFTSSIHTLDWNDVKILKPPRVVDPNAPVRRAVKDKYSVLSAMGEYSEVTLDATKDICYFLISEYSPYNKDDRYYAHRRLAQLFPNQQIVRLESNRKDKFLRDFPKAQAIKPMVESKSKVFYSGWTQEMKIAYSYGKAPSYCDMVRLRPHLSQISDPKVKEVLDLADKVDLVNTNALRSQHQDFVSLNKIFPGWNIVERIENKHYDWDAHLKKWYPLFDHGHMNASVAYMNWLYSTGAVKP